MNEIGQVVGGKRFLFLVHLWSGRACKGNGKVKYFFWLFSIALMARCFLKTLFSKFRFIFASFVISKLETSRSESSSSSRWKHFLASILLYSVYFLSQFTGPTASVFSVQFLRKYFQTKFLENSKLNVSLETF